MMEEKTEESIEPIMDIEVKNDLDEDIELDDKESDEVNKEEAVDDGEEPQDKEELDEEEEEVPEEAKKMLNPNQKPKTQKRIIGLTKKVKELKKKLKESQERQDAREIKEINKETDQKYQDIVKKQQKAFDDGDMAKLTELNLDLAQLPTKQDPIDKNFDTEGYFRTKFEWYEVDERKTNNAIALDLKLRNNPDWVNRSPKDRLDEVGRRTERLFKKNPYRKSSPSDGAPISRGSLNSFTMTQSNFNLYKNMYPNKEKSEIFKIAKEDYANISKVEKER